ncbi:hypothetical protein GYB22_02420 [bacterium]|nr:hypothetical protein [bacterium]
MLRPLLLLFISFHCLGLIAQDDYFSGVKSKYVFIKAEQAEIRQYILKDKQPELPASREKIIINGDEALIHYYDTFQYGTYWKYYFGSNSYSLDIFSNNSFSVVIKRNVNDYELQLFDSNSTIIQNANVKCVGEDEYFQFDPERNCYLVPNKYRNSDVIEVDVNGEWGCYSLEGSHEKFKPKVLKAPDPAKIKGFRCAAMLSQPKYRPGDTLRLTGIMFYNKEAYQEQLEVSLKQYDYRTRRQVLKKFELNPDQEGRFNLEYIIEDSFILDQTLTVLIYAKKRWSTYSNELRCEYADYELKDENISARMVTIDKQQYVSLYSDDGNGFPLIGAEFKISAEFSKYYFDEIDKTYYLDEQIFEEHIFIDSQNQLIKIPEAIKSYPQGRPYSIEVQVRTQDNILLTNHMYYRDEEEVELRYQLDTSIFIEYLVNGVSTEKKATLYFVQNNTTKKTELNLPCHVDLNPGIKLEHVRTDDDAEYFNLDSRFRFRVIPSYDSLKAYISNARSLPFEFKIYQDDILIKEGNSSSDTLELHLKRINESSYHISMQHIWNGQEVEQWQRVHPYEKTVNLSVEEPRKIFPGQKVSIKVKATDYSGKPVSNLAVAGDAITSDFNRNVPRYLPDFNPNYFYNQHLEDKTLDTRVHDLKDRLSLELLRSVSLDTAAFAKVMFPEDRLALNYFDFGTDKTKNPHRQGQLACFVFEGDKWAAISQIYVDSTLRYDANFGKVESLILDTGKHKIGIRTYKHYFIIKDIEIKVDQKLILSFDTERLPKEVIAEKRGKRLSDNEFKALQNSMTYVVYQGSGNVISSRYQERPLYHGYRYSQDYFHTALVGPFKSGEEIKVKTIKGLYVTYFVPGTYYLIENGELNVLPLEVHLNSNKAKKDPESYSISAYQYFPAGVKWAVNDEISLYEHPRYPKGSEVFLYDQKYYPSILKNHETGELRSYNANFLNSTRLEAGLYEVYFFSKDSFWKTDTFRVLSGKLNLIKVSIISKGAVSEIDSLLNYFSEAAVLDRFIAGRKGLIIQKPDNLNLPSIFNINKKHERSLEHITYSLSSGERDTLYFENNYAFLPLSQPVIITFHFPTECGESQVVRYVPNNNPEYVQHVTLEQNCLDENRNLYLAATVVCDYNEKYNYLNYSGSTKFRLAYDYFPAYSNRSRGITRISAREIQSAPMIEKDKNVRSFSWLNPLHEDSDGDGVSDYFDAAAYGENGAYVVDIRGNAIEIPFGDNANDLTYQATIMDSIDFGTGAIRQSFSDLGFWQEFIFTDENGEATIDVKFPDDITTWKTQYIAMHINGLTGQTSGRINSYLPVSAELSTSRFLIEGDSLVFKGVLKNKTGQGFKTQSSFSYNGQEIWDRSDSLKQVSSYDLAFRQTGVQDKDTFLFKMETEEGIKDAELRTVEVLRKGLSIAEGNYITCNKDSSYVLELEEETQLYFLDQPISVLIKNLEDVINYEYLCNEQIASKLRAQVLLHNAPKGPLSKLKDPLDLKKWITKLEENQHSNGSWSWWGAKGNNLWMTCYTLEALHEASQIGYGAKGIAKGINYLENYMTHASNYEKQVILHCFLNLNHPYAYEVHIPEGENIDELILIARIKQRLGQQPDIETLIAESSKDALGGIYWKNNRFSFGSPELRNTIYMYELLKSNRNPIQKQVHQYLMNQSLVFNSLNTYESIWLVEAVFKDELAEYDEESVAYVKIEGDELEKELKHFDGVKLPAGKYVIRINTDHLVYLSTSHRSFVPEPEIDSNLYQIQSYFIQNGDTVSKLQAGKEAQLIVKINVKSASSYLSLAVPIPSSCSYVDPGYSLRYLSHTEEYRDHKNFYFENLEEGTYTIPIQLLPRFEGEFTLNPVLLEQMYFPMLNGNNELKLVEVGN